MNNLEQNKKLIKYKNLLREVMNMVFYYDRTEEKQQECYERMMRVVASLSKLFSENKKPYISPRIPENLFCKYFEAENLSRSDVTADAKKDTIGISIKTWIDTRYQKIVEFDKNKQELDKLSNSNKRLICKIAELRNERIDFTLRTYGMTEMVYHCVERDNGCIRILECPLEKIDIPNIKNVKKNKNTISFEDGEHRYGFNTSKSTLYMYFDDMEEIKTIKVDIADDPFMILEKMQMEMSIQEGNGIKLDRVYLPLYSKTKNKGKYVPNKNSLNIRFAKGRKRNLYEVGIPVPKVFHEKYSDFFPARGTSFDLLLPNGKVLSVKICQQNGKALMSKPNKELGRWLIDDVLKINPDVKITYDMLDKYGLDSVCIEKCTDATDEKTYYKINFATIDSYEYFIGNITRDTEEKNSGMNS